MGKLINIDNGGTLTDIVVVDGDDVVRTKTLTTPYDLSKCFFEGLRKVSQAIYGKEDVVGLLRDTDYIRYSTTQGTNALVERKGPRVGLILADAAGAGALQDSASTRELFSALVGERVAAVDPADDGDLDGRLVAAVNALTAGGANRIVVGMAGEAGAEAEARLRRIVLAKFPPHLLGAVPVLFSHQIAGDADDGRRIWSALLNAFLHPAMETFLYHAEHKLRDARFRSPLLIFRNDGDSARVAKTIALKTYSSGPRGGMEGARALAAHYGVGHLVSVDVGGTTTDIGATRGGHIESERRGRVEGVRVSFPLVDIHSVGVGGGSVIRAQGGEIRVGPESVGAQPGPACFGLGGKHATITDVFLLMGVLDPEAFFGGDLALDVERARAAVLENVARPLDMSVGRALAAMEAAWVERVAAGIREHCDIGPDTVLAAFGGGGPLAICTVAEALGVGRVLVPRLAAVFSAYGLSFSDIAHHYEVALPEASQAAYDAAIAGLTEQARRDMFAEGFSLDDCQLAPGLVRQADGQEHETALPDGRLPAGLDPDARCSATLSATRPIRHARFGSTGTPAEVSPITAGERMLRDAVGEARPVPLVRLADNPPGATGTGPAVLEEDFFTCRVPAGWRYRFTAGGDIELVRES
ncbi:MAG: hydantoinase/oxoprolinase family protein [Rhodocyclaceae bacterium]|nr:hydantoinase/oxoprolinase family protein [Rhodocyclaceae bacterium]